MSELVGLDGQAINETTESYKASTRPKILKLEKFLERYKNDSAELIGSLYELINVAEGKHQQINDPHRLGFSAKTEVEFLYRLVIALTYNLIQGQVLTAQTSLLAGDHFVSIDEFLKKNGQTLQLPNIEEYLSAVDKLSETVEA